METCQTPYQEQTRNETHCHHVCKFDYNYVPSDIKKDDDDNANETQQQLESNLRALMIVTTLIGIVSSFLTYLLPLIVCDKDKTEASLLAALYMSAALTSLPITTSFLFFYRKECNVKQG